MFAPPNAHERDTLLSLIARSPDGVRLDRIVQAFPPDVDSRKIKQWIDSLADENLIFAGDESRDPPYLATDLTALRELYGIEQASVAVPMAVAPATPSGTSPTPTSGHALSPLANTPAGEAAASSVDVSVVAPAVAQTPKLAPAGTTPATPLPVVCPPTSVMPSVTPAASAQSSATPSGGPSVPPGGDAAATAPSDPEFPQMLELAVPYIIGNRLTRQATISKLREHAANNGKTGRGMGAYVQYVLAYLDRVTPIDVEAYGITADEFDVWRKRFAPPPPVVPAPVASTKPIAQPPTAAEKKIVPMGGPVPEDKAASRPAGSSQGPQASAPAASEPEESFDQWLRKFFPAHLGSATKMALAGMVGMLVVGVQQAVAGRPWVIIGFVLVGLLGLFLFSRSKGASAPAGGTSLSAWFHRMKNRLIGAGVLVVVAVAGYLVYRAQQYPSKSALSNYLATSVTSVPIRVTSLTPLYSSVSSTGCTLTYQAQVETTQPLYRQLNTADYLRTNFPKEFSVLTAFRPPSAVLSETTLLTLQTLPGTSALCSGRLLAWHHDGGWSFSGEPMQLNRSILAGEPKQSGANVYVIDLAEDVARLNATVAAAARAANLDHATSNIQRPGMAGNAVTAPTVDVSGLAAVDPKAPTERQPDTPKPEPAGRAPSSPASDTPIGRSSGTQDGAPAPRPNSQRPATTVTAVTPLDRSMDKPGRAATPPPYPAATGAYVLIDGRWVLLPQNNGIPRRTTSEYATGGLVTMKYKENASAGIPNETGKEIVGDIVFNGTQPVPAIPPVGITIVYIGQVVLPTAAQIKKYPELKDEPAIELERSQTLHDGTRDAALYFIAPDAMSFGPHRVPAKVTQPRDNTTVLVCTELVPPGRYALSCNTRCYELEVAER